MVEQRRYIVTITRLSCRLQGNFTGGVALTKRTQEAETKDRVDSLTLSVEDMATSVMLVLQ